MATTKWTIDPTHSEIGFKVKHMMFTNVSGKFQEFEATAETEEELFENVNFEFTAKTSSVNTGNPDRDAHLNSGDFFDSENYPEIAFKSTSYKKVSNGAYELKGDLSLKGVSKPVTLNIEFHGTALDPWGNKKAGFGITGKINRKDWGLNWNSALEAGGVLVGEEVKLVIELQFVKQ
ncbi:YceI family protein [Confluentibacter sediminis]|uniref:YceI family protein n=1 Tax=Confluentibacter sediminis TaxID=2219045 RepID=UPI000DAD46E9|nr:YceI family protein [Confluentibacter sediminis]